MVNNNKYEREYMQCYCLESHREAFLCGAFLFAIVVLLPW